MIASFPSLALYSKAFGLGHACFPTMGLMEQKDAWEAPLGN